ncbi:DUF4093 domain-containing protein [Alicyclobacillus sp.]|uniref:toprim domain-containing protein n=1 Tax=Alicyclobacillus sp. TaxID=61169 RepID=UPI0025C6F416|nr:DUF4093 domain-containing protein [Alicyclobacillus sp.]MCL6516622.1 DUF4093 domain-containing protein [Alicyclobacillus sp.]
MDGPGGTAERSQRLRVREIVVVEGWHDKQAVDRAVDADVFVLGGDRVAARTIDELRRASAHRGVILLTDPDGPGERIRGRIDRAVPNCKHAQIPRRLAIGHGRVGIEYADPQAIRNAILAARPTEDAPGRAPEFQLEDLAAAGLTRHPDAARRRRLVGERLGIGYANAKAFLKKLNALGVTRAEWRDAIRSLTDEEGEDGDPGECRETE